MFAEFVSEGEWLLSYDSGGRVSKVQGGGQMATYSYNDNGELTQAVLDGDPSSVVDSFSVSLWESPSIGGSVVGGGTYDEGSSASLTANASAGFVFSNWSGAGVSAGNVSNNPLILTVDSDKSLTAHFRLAEETIEYTSWISALYPEATDASLLFGSLDNDHDGWSNRLEFLMGFLPNDSASSLQLRLSEINGSIATIEYNRIRPTGVYRLYHSTNLTDWNLVDSLSPVEGAEGYQLQHEGQTDATEGFFRVVFEAH